MGINFQKLVWIDRISDNPNRRKLTKVGESEGVSMSSKEMIIQL